MHSNHLVEEAIAQGVATTLVGYDHVRREVPCSASGGGSRLDFQLRSGDDIAWLEVKTATLVESLPNGGKVALFPDAPTERGRRHLEVLRRCALGGDRAVLCFVVQRRDVDRVTSADAVDPRYGEALRTAIADGVEVLAYGARVGPRRIRLERALEVPLTQPPSRRLAQRRSR